MQQVPADSVAAALTRVLARPEFGNYESAGIMRTARDLIDAFWHWLGRMILRMMPDSWHPAFGWIIVGVVAALALWAVYLLVNALIRAPRSASSADTASPVILLHREDVAWWLQAARSAAATLRFREAAAALYIATVLHLDARGVLRYNPARTPGDYRREVRSHPASSRTFDRFIGQFLPVAYGERAPDAASYDALRSTATELGVNA